MATAINLEPETVEALDAMVTSGRFTSHDEAIRTALYLVQESDAAAEPLDADEMAWLADAIAEADADPDGGIPAEDVFAEMKQLCREDIKRHRAAQQCTSSPTGPTLFYYRVQPGRASVLAVRHGARRPPRFA